MLCRHVQPVLINTHEQTLTHHTHHISSTSRKHAHWHRNWHSMPPTTQTHTHTHILLPPPPTFCFHIPKYQAAEHQTLPVSRRPISVVFQHCYLPVMVGFSFLLSVCRTTNCCCWWATGRRESRRGDGWRTGTEKGVWVVGNIGLRTGDDWKWRFLTDVEHNVMYPWFLFPATAHNMRKPSKGKVTRRWGAFKGMSFFNQCITEDGWAAACGVEREVRSRTRLGWKTKARVNSYNYSNGKIRTVSFHKMTWLFTY